MAFPTALPDDPNSLQDSISGLLDLARDPIRHYQPSAVHPNTVPPFSSDGNDLPNSDDSRLIVDEATIPPNITDLTTEAHVRDADTGQPPDADVTADSTATGEEVADTPIFPQDDTGQPPDVNVTADSMATGEEVADTVFLDHPHGPAPASLFMPEPALAQPPYTVRRSLRNRKPRVRLSMVARRLTTAAVLGLYAALFPPSTIFVDTFSVLPLCTHPFQIPPPNHCMNTRRKEPTSA